MIKKESVIHDYTLFPTIQSHMGSITAWRHDYTLKKDPLEGPGFESRLVPMFFAINICAFIRRSYGEGKHRDGYLHIYEKKFKDMCEVNQPALGQRG
ncbi:hypothetical protein RR46_05808 [Papilio xuthus]|uniref:Uncharacterized protein n=1 Tax=Papilio xuthus TaxID=66420 RepID=A0A194PM93_PAPXU|nr:hypothetical protein RR46_05808 [Papilio xuthus]